jgi:NAD-dependent DNA ligase
MVLLLSQDNHVVEFPSSALPENTTIGSIVNVTIERNLDEEEKARDEFNRLQYEIYQEFSTPPKTPIVRVVQITQTSCTIEWDPIELYNATFKSIEVARNGVVLSVKPNEFTTKLKLSGLELATKYEVQIILKTSAGTFPSNKLDIETHSMDNLTGLNISFGAFANESEIDNLIEILETFGATYTESLTSDNTHLICTLPKGPKYEKALELNIPIVTPEFLKACELNKQIMLVNSYYVEQKSL